MSVALLLSACGGTTAPPAATPSPVATDTHTPVPSPTATLTPTVTETATVTPTIVPGPVVSYLGLAGADDSPLESVGSDGEGRPIFERRFGQAFSIVVEARPGGDGVPVGFSAYDYDPENPTIRPDLQVLLSRPIGDGSTVVCDNEQGNFGGVPAVDPPDYSFTQFISDAINDLGCRFNDGTGNPGGRGSSDACTIFPDALFHFVDPSSKVQFCAPIAAAFKFPDGDTIVTARVRNVDDVLSAPRQIVVRVNPDLINTPTDTPTPGATHTPTATPTEGPPLQPGANITYFGVTQADNTLLQPIGVDDQDRPIYQRRVGYSFSLVIEGRSGSNGAAVGQNAFEYDPQDPSVRPDLQVLVSQPLGDGSTTVCDNMLPNIGGVPGVDPPDFSETQPISDAINDLGCRFDDGTGQAVGRNNQDACTTFVDGGFHFVADTSQVQFCALIEPSFGFPLGDTIVTARLRDGQGIIGPERQIVLRVTG